MKPVPFEVALHLDQGVLGSTRRGTDASAREVLDVLRAMRAAIDFFICDDCVVILWNSVFVIRPNAVEAALQRAVSHDHRVLDYVDNDREDALASALGLAAETYAESPVRSFWSILAKTLDYLGRGGAEADARIPYQVMSAAWDTLRSTPGAGAYIIGSAGRERTFEDWLIDKLPSLANFGYPVTLDGTELRGGQRQWRALDGRIADLVCRYTDADEAFCPGDWLVIENKTVGADEKAVEQLLHYVQAAEHELAGTNERVAGLLVADGASSAARDRIRAEGFGYLTLSEIGYRDHLYRMQADAGMAAEPTTAAPTAAPMPQAGRVRSRNRLDR